MALAARGLCDSREQAKRLILAGEVKVNGHPAVKPGQVVKVDDLLEVKAKPRYVSRGGLKLEGALGAFGIHPEGMVCCRTGRGGGMRLMWGRTNWCGNCGATRGWWRGSSLT